MALSIPVTDYNDIIPIWLCKRNWDNLPIIDDKRTKATRGSLETKRREVKETPNLILDLELVCPIPFGRNWTICAKNSILPWISPHLNPRPVTNISHKFVKLKIEEQRKNNAMQQWNQPCNKQIFIQVIVHVHDNIVISCNVDDGPWKLPVDSYDLQINFIEHWSQPKSGLIQHLLPGTLQTPEHIKFKKT